MHGLMQEIPLMISSLIRYAAEYHGGREVVSRTVEGPIHRYGYAECERRARRVANVMGRLGIGHGDRVGTLAWNGYRHLELFYGVSGTGAVLHTVNPRLFTEQIVYIVNHAEDRVLFVDLTFVELVERIANQLTTVEHVVVMTDEEHMPADRAAQRLLLRDPAGGRERGLRLARLRRARRVLPLLHLGHDGQSQGRALQPPLHPAARHGRLPEQRHERLRPRRADADCADVSRQRLVAALSRLPRRCRPGAAPARRWTARACRS